MEASCPLRSPHWQENETGKRSLVLFKALGCKVHSRLCRMAGPHCQYDGLRERFKRGAAPPTLAGGGTPQEGPSRHPGLRHGEAGPDLALQQRLEPLLLLLGRAVALQHPRQGVAERPPPPPSRGSSSGPADSGWLANTLLADPLDTYPPPTQKTPTCRLAGCPVTERSDKQTDRQEDKHSWWDPDRFRGIRASGGGLARETANNLGQSAGNVEAFRPPKNSIRTLSFLLEKVGYQIADLAILLQKPQRDRKCACGCSVFSNYISELFRKKKKWVLF